MAITATFKTKKGTKTWQVSSSYIMDFDGFSTGYELNAENNETVEGSPKSNKRGLKKKQLAFSSNLHISLGIDVRKEFESWESWIGQVGILKIGGKKFGPNWMLTSVKPSDTKIDNSGRFLSMKLTYSFEENDEVTDKEILASVNAARSAVHLTASTAQKSSKKATNKAVKTAPKKAAASKAIAVGDVVHFKGGPHYTSSTATKYKTSPKAGPAKVTAIVKSAKHPYHVIHTDKTSTVYGWVDADKISK
jgi:hypothetical protein